GTRSSSAAGGPPGWRRREAGRRGRPRRLPPPNTDRRRKMRPREPRSWSSSARGRRGGWPALPSRNVIDAPRGGGVHERGIVGKQPRVIGPGADLSQLRRADRAVDDRHLVGLAGPIVEGRGPPSPHPGLLPRGGTK